MRKVVLLPEALADYREALRWYHDRSRQAAAAFGTTIDVAIAKIVDSAAVHPFCDEIHQFYILRRFPFSIVYRVESETIVVVAIAHSSREAGYWRRK